MTRTDAIRAAILAELEQHRPALDGGCGIDTVTLIARLDKRTGRVRSLVLRQESHRELPPAAR